MTIEEEQSAEIVRLEADREKLRSALRLIFSCGVQQEDVLSNKYKIVIPEYVLFEVEGLMNEAMGKRDD